MMAGNSEFPMSPSDSGSEDALSCSHAVASAAPVMAPPSAPEAIHRYHRSSRPHRTRRFASAFWERLAGATGSRVALAAWSVASHTLEDSTPAHSFSTLMAQLATIVGNTCRTPGTGPDAQTFDIITTPEATHRHALDLIKQIRL